MSPLLSLQIVKPLVLFSSIDTNVQSSFLKENGKIKCQDCQAFCEQVPVVLLSWNKRLKSCNTNLKFTSTFTEP